MFNLLHRSCFGNVKLLGALFLTFLLGLAGAARAGEFTNFLGIKLVDVPAGSFKMGSCKVTKNMHIMNKKRAFLDLPLLTSGCEKDSLDVNDNETPQHEVNIKAFRLAATPITLGQYKHYLDAIGVEEEESSWNLINEEFNRLNNYGENAPVAQVSWNEAREFIAWLNENKPLTDRHIYRFVSESEWEYSCRAGENHLYCGSDRLDSVGWVDLSENSNQRDVATKAPNAWGIYDMTGNVWEWVGDVYHETYEKAPSDGSAWTVHTEASAKAHSLKLQMLEAEEAMGVVVPARAMRVSNSNARFLEEQKRFDRANHGKQWKRDTETSRVLRGGSWRFGVNMATATYRLSGEPGNWYYGNGFRVAATLP